MRFGRIGQSVAALFLLAGSGGVGTAVLFPSGSGVAGATTPAACPAAVVSGGTATVTCSYNGTTGADGSAQSWTVPAGVTQATFDVYGAQGGSSGGAGGEATGTFTVVPGSTFQINAGGQPSGSNGGYNGGGTGASGGGGASDVRDGAYGLTDRIVVGGGGGGSTSVSGGGGGGANGTTGDPEFCGNLPCGGGGTSSGGGSAGTPSLCDPTFLNSQTITPPTDGGPGVGGNGGSVLCMYLDPLGNASTLNATGDGGGGGWFGGGGGGALADLAGGSGTVAFGLSGGGGSGYIDPSANSSLPMQTGVNSGNGYVVITYVVSGGPIQITSTSLPDATLHQPYSFQLEAIGGTPPYNINKYGPKGTGVLPRGLRLSRSGLISGTPKQTGTFIIVVKCLDVTHRHKTQALEKLTLTVNP